MSIFRNLEVFQSWEKFRLRRYQRKTMAPDKNVQILASGVNETIQYYFLSNKNRINDSETSKAATLRWRRLGVLNFGLRGFRIG